jgi:outer membrane protein assembly factor BamB
MNNRSKHTTIILLTLFALSCTITLFPSDAQTIDSTTSNTSTTSNPQPGILWNITLPWNLTNTPAQNLSDTQIIEMRKYWLNPVVNDEIVYAGVTSSVYYGRHFGPSKDWINVYAVNAKTGQTIWDFQANFRFDSETKLAVSDGKIYLAVEGSTYAEGYVIALNATNGSQLWITPCTFLKAVPVTDGGNVFINSDHSLVGFNGIDGRVLWNYTTHEYVYPPNVANGILYAASYDKHLYAINTTNGSHLWDVYTYEGFSSVTAAENVVYAPSKDGNIYAFNSLTGAMLWKRNLTPPEFTLANSTTFYTTPFYNNGLLFFTSESSQHLDIPENNGADLDEHRTSVYVLEASTGNKIWNYSVIDSSFEYPVSVVDGVVYTRTGGGILGFNYQNGALIWNYTIVHVLPQTDPVSYEGILYVGYYGGQMYALNPTELGMQLHNPYFIIVGGQVIDLALFAVIVTVVVVLFVIVIFHRRKHTNKLSKQSP